MRPTLCLPLLFSCLLSVSAVAADCSTYRGSATPLPKDVAATLDKTFAAVHAHNARNLFALTDRKVMLVRRMVSNSSDRSGNIRLELRQRDLDSGFNIRIVDQAMTELAQPAVFSGIATDNALTVRRDICEDARKCDDAMPGPEQLPFMLNDLLQCNQYAKGVYVYDDGMYVVDAAAAPGKMPIGTVLYFGKAGAAYKLAGVVILN
jgi:hypothetical protein